METMSIGIKSTKKNKISKYIEFDLIPHFPHQSVSHQNEKHQGCPPAQPQEYQCHDPPRDKIVVITGVSGSGKSTLAFDILYASSSSGTSSSLHILLPIPQSIAFYPNLSYQRLMDLMTRL